MSIKDFQLAKSIKKAKLSLLKKGKAPTSAQVTTLSSDMLNNAGLGYPTFSPQYGEKYGVSDKVMFNNMLSIIHNDLTDLYDADSHLNNEVLSLFSYYDTEKKNTINLLNKLQRKLDSVLYAMEDTSVKGNIVNSFDDFLNIDFVGDKDKNIFETDAYINLLSKYASNDILSSYKVNLSSAKISFDVSSKFVKNQELSSIKNCINDNTSETWVQKITSEQISNLTTTLEIELDKEEIANSLRINLSSAKKLVVSVMLQDEAGEVKELSKIESYDECEWCFRNTPIKKITIAITKTEPDNTDATNFEYYIGAKNISLCKNVYATQSMFVSKPYDIPSPFSQVYLECDTTMPQATDMRYFIGVEKPNRSVNWIAVKNNTLNELNLLSTSIEAISYGVIGYGSLYNKSLYVLSELSHIPVSKSLSLDVGNGMWSVKEIAYTGDTDLKEIYNQRTSRFINTDTIQFTIPKKTVQMLSINAYCDNSLELSSSILTPQGVRKYVFVNGMAIQSMRSLMANGTLNINLSIGWNTISIITVNETEEEKQYIFDAYFKDKSVVTVGELKSEEIDMYDMLNSTPTNAFNKYTVVDNKIIVNYDPQDTSIACKAKYCYDTSNIFDDAKVRFMCTMRSDTNELTPKLYSYQITMASNTQSPTSTDGGTLDGLFAVTYLDWNGAVLRIDYVPEGFASTPPKDPIRLGYTFTNWDKDVSEINEDTIVTAVYKRTSYLVIFKNWNGDTLSTQYVEYGKDAIEPKIPIYETGMANVQFLNKDGEQIALNTIKKGQSVTPPVPPVVAGYKFKEWKETTYTGPAIEEGFEFLRWSESFLNVQNDLVIYAIFGVPTVYTVNFYSKDNVLLESKKVNEGGSVVPPIAPAVDNFRFKEWKEK